MLSIFVRNFAIPDPKSGPGIPTPNLERDFFTLDKIGLAGLRPAKLFFDLMYFEEKGKEWE